MAMGGTLVFARVGPSSGYKMARGGPLVALKMTRGGPLSGVRNG